MWRSSACARLESVFTRGLVSVRASVFQCMFVYVGVDLSYTVCVGVKVSMVSFVKVHIVCVGVDVSYGVILLRCLWCRLLR